MDKNYFIGIDFGHGETTVSRVSGYNTEAVSRVPLRFTGHGIDKKVVSALCKHDDGWHFVWSQEDFKRPDIRVGFKGIIGKLDPTRKEALGEFAKLIFHTILENDQDLVYDENTGEANFAICIACPSDWRRQDPETPKEYLKFFRDECGIKPIEMCINESDAILIHNSRYRSLFDTTILQIVIGTSSMDFSLYSNQKNISECSWGINTGTHIIEDIIVDYIFRNNEDNLKEVLAYGQGRELCDIYTVIFNIVKKSVDDYFVYNKCFFECEARFRDLVSNWPSRIDAAFCLCLSNKEFMHLIQADTNILVQSIKHASTKLNNFGVKPNVVLLSGVGCKIGFIRDIVKSEFPNAKILQDISPEYAISNGNALYVQKIYQDKSFIY